jgi:polysaccharide biosynthesis protein PslH
MQRAQARPQLLMIAPVMPDEAGNGLAMRVGFFLEALARRFAVDLAVVPLAGAGDAASGFARRHARRFKVFPLSDTDSHFALIARLRDERARLEALRHYGRPARARFVTDALRRELGAWTGGVAYAAVHVSRLYLLDLLYQPGRRGAAAPTLFVDADENDALVHRRQARRLRLSGERLAADFADVEAHNCEQHARSLLRRADWLMAATRCDLDSLCRHAPQARTSVVPNVAPRMPGALPTSRSARRTGPPTLLFVATMSYAPNADGALWFVTRVWPILRRLVPRALRLVLAGRSPPPALLRWAGSAGIEVAADVPDVAPLYRAADVAVVPIQAGGGSRIKILEAAAFGVPVVSTRIGAEGLTLRAPDEILIADEPHAFAAACARLLGDGALARRQATAASYRLAREYRRETWLERTHALAGDLLARRHCDVQPIGEMLYA